MSIKEFLILVHRIKLIKSNILRDSLLNEITSFTLKVDEVSRNETKLLSYMPQTGMGSINPVPPTKMF